LYLNRVLSTQSAISIVAQIYYNTTNHGEYNDKERGIVVPPVGNNMATKKVSLDDFVALLDDSKTTIQLSMDTETYWKRWFAYSCSNRTIGFHELSYVVKGRICGDIAGEPIDLGANGVFWMNPDVRHSMKWCENLIYYTFRFLVKRGDEEIALDRPSLQRANAASMETLFRNLAYIVKHDTSSKYRDRQTKAYFLLITAALATILEGEESVTQNRKLSDAEKAAVFKFCSGNEFVDIDSGTLADDLGLSRDYFSRVFKRTYGKSVRSWIFEEKMRFAARQILDTELSVAEIADHMGYLDEYLFSRLFKRVLGLSPRQYQERNQWEVYR
jgi:AraC-like DNA-binding protein